MTFHFGILVGSSSRLIYKAPFGLKITFKTHSFDIDVAFSQSKFKLGLQILHFSQTRKQSFSKAIFWTYAKIAPRFLAFATFHLTPLFIFVVNVL